MNNENYLGKKIKELRKAMGFTQEKLAEYANIDDKHLSKIENGIHLPSFNTLKKLSEILNFNLQDINFEQNNNINNISKNLIYQKSLKILNSARNEQELYNYYAGLKLINKILNSKKK